MKKLIELLCYAAGAAALFAALAADIKADDAVKQDILNRSGNPPSVNQKAPDFTIKRLLNEDIVSSKDLLANGNFIVIISAPSCPATSILAEQLKEELALADISTENVHIVLDVTNTPLSREEQLSWNESYPEIKIYADEASSVVWGYKVQAYPTTYVISKDGFVLYRQSGFAGEKAVKLLVKKFI